jgi:DNA-binding CsgD family transcriptional regulator
MHVALRDHRQGLAEVERLTAAGRMCEAIDVARQLVDTPGLEPALAARMRLTLSSMLSVVGQPGEAVEQAEIVLAQPRLPGEVYLAADVRRLIGLVAAGDMTAAQAHAEAILAGDGQPAGDADMAGAVAVVGLTAWNEGRAADALRLLTAAVRRTELGPPVVRRLNPRLGTATLLGARGDFDAAHAAVDLAHGEVAGEGDPFWAAGPAAVDAWLHLGQGHLDDATASAQAALDISEELGSEFFWPAAQWVLATVALHRGELAVAARRVGSYQRSTGVPAGGLGPGAYTWLSGQLAEAQGRDERAADVLQPVYDHLQDHRWLLVDQPGAAAWLVRAALRTGDRLRAGSVVVCADQLAAANPGWAPLAAAAAHARGLLEGDPAAVATAAEWHRHPWPRASAHEDAGVLLAELGRHGDAAVHLEAARRGYERAGATRDARRAGARLTGGRHGRHGRRHGHVRAGDRPVSGWASLTESERRVARVVAEGRTNAQAAADLFLSPHTIDFHLRQIYRKLGIASRVELVRIVMVRS